MLDHAVGDNERQSLDQNHVFNFESRQIKRSRQAKLGIAQDLERQMESLRHLALIGARLRAQSENARAERGKFPIVVAKGASLRRAAAGTGNEVPDGSGRPGTPVMG